jgi:hypothetical protein
LRDHQQVRRIAVDGFKGRLVRREVLGCLHPVPGGADLVSGNQVDDRRKVDGLGPAKGDRRRAQFECFQNFHIPSLPGPWAGVPGASPVSGLAAARRDGVNVDA